MEMIYENGDPSCCGNCIHSVEKLNFILMCNLPKMTKEEKYIDTMDWCSEWSPKTSESKKM